MPVARNSIVWAKQCPGRTNRIHRVGKDKGYAWELSGRFGPPEFHSRFVSVAQNSSIRDTTLAYQERASMVSFSLWFIPFFHFHPIFLLLSLFLYFLPAFLARNKPDFTSILILNILAGWTFIGWIIALVWALSSGRQQQVAAPAQSTASPQPRTAGSFFCTSCGKPCPAGARFCSSCGATQPATSR